MDAIQAQDDAHALPLGEDLPDLAFGAGETLKQRIFDEALLRPKPAEQDVSPRTT